LSRSTRIRRSAVGGQGAIGAGAGGGRRGDLGGGHAEREEEVDQHVGGIGGLAAVAPQVHIELPVRIVAAQAVGDAQRERGLPDAADPAEHRERDRFPAGPQREPEPLPQPLPTDEVARRRRELLRAGGGRDLLDPCGRGPVGFGGGA
jgi:hypothetical protein